MSLISLNAELRQELRLTPQLLQSMEILQMNSQELLDYLAHMAEENPVVEQEPPLDLQEAYEELRQKASWIDGGLYGSSFSHEARAIPEQGRPDRETESLSAFLRDQLDRMGLPKPLLSLSKYIAGLTDEDGYLTQEDLDGLLEMKIPQALIDQALETVQGLEPAGVGARNLSECLLLQLARQPHGVPAAPDIAARFLPELGRKHYGPICRELGIGLEAVQAAEKAISALDPHPGRAFQPAEPAVYVRPDIFIVELDGQLQAVLNEYCLPRVSISSHYTRLLQDSEEQEIREYLHQKIQQAKWLLDSLERRSSTLQRCASAILEAQRPFFAGETAELSPLGLASLSRVLALHPSTISRAIRGKYLQCRQGTYPLRHFFSRAVGGGPSRQAIQQKLLALVRNEDPKHPYSDQQLCELLSSGGVKVARRTVVKYRMELGIGSSVVRKTKQ